MCQELAEIHVFVYYQDGGCPSSWICCSSVLDHSLSPLMPVANGVMIRSDLTETLRFYVFVDLAENAYSHPFGAAFGAQTLVLDRHRA